MSLVLDCSMAMAWCFEDEQTSQTVAVLDSVGRSGAWVPLLWRYEVANVLLMAERRGRIDAAKRHDFLDTLRDLSIREDREPEGDPWHATVRLAELHRLTVYDAAYLELAQRRRLPLASLDEPLRKAAGATGVRVEPA